MSSLRPPGLGPIVGHTTDRTARIWVRAADPHDSGAALDETRRSLGVIAVVEENGKRVRTPRVHYFRLRREFDRTGTFELGRETGIHPKWEDGDEKIAHPPLQPDTRYKVVVGTLTLDDPFPADTNVSDAHLAKHLPEARVWREELRTLEDNGNPVCTTEFTTLPRETGEAASSLAFILGSCRYPGILWKVKEADKIFGPMRDEALGQGLVTDGESARPPAQFTLMIGDQIYADMLNRHVPIGLADTFQEFQDRYHEAFGSRHMRALLKSVPTYMILDDHEIEDNWTQDRISDADSRKTFNLAIGAYMSYQWSHGPRSYGRQLYYRFEGAGYPFFVLDTRTQRFMDDVEGALTDNHLLGRPSAEGEEPSQLDRLLKWLRDAQAKRGNAPKFIVSPSVFVPSPMNARTRGQSIDEMNRDRPRKLQKSDSWPAFPETRRALLQTIIDHGIQNVVFLSGDIHCSNVSEINFGGTPDAEELKAFSIVSSAFYWPFWFADGNPSNFVHDSTKGDQCDTFHFGDGYRMDYRAWNFTQEDNYCRVDIDRETASITVQPFGIEGQKIHKRDWDGQPTDTALTATLDLVPW